MITIDTETVGLSGVIVLIQWAEDHKDSEKLDGEIHLHCPWIVPVSQTIQLIEKFANHEGGLLFFNAVFDYFHLYKMWTMWKIIEKELGGDVIPEALLGSQKLTNYLVDVEDRARDYPDCLKPKKVLDVFLHARKTSYQSTMERKDIKIKKIPTQLAWLLASELEKRVPLKDIYFARRKDKNLPKWQVQDIKDTFGEVDPDWKNIVVRFKPSSALKALAVDALEIPEDKILRYADISPKLWPVEFGYAPFAKAAMKIKLKDISKQKKRVHPYKNTWPDYIRHHILHWGYHEEARQYAADDIFYTRGLFNFFGRPEFGDDDSELACMVGAARWRGYRVDVEGIKQLKQKALDKQYKIVNGEKVLLPTSPRDVKRYIMDACNEIEKLAFTQDYADTKKVTLENLAKSENWLLPCDCRIINRGEYDRGMMKPKEPDPDCDLCNGKGVHRHEASNRAREILETRKAAKEVELYEKLLAAGRLHASFKIIGTLSSRMAGADKLNTQAIHNSKEVKKQFLFARDDEDLSGGDFDAFEVTIAEAEYNDPNLRKDLLTCEACKSEMIFNQQILDYECTQCKKNTGQAIHALFGTFVYKPMTYEEIKNSKGQLGDKYTPSKQAVFLKMYGGDYHTMCERLGVSPEVAQEADRQFDRKYVGVFKAQERVRDSFASMRQPNGRGTKVEWHEPSEYIETMLGFRRYFTLENKIVRALFNLANKLPDQFRQVRLRVTRTDRVQTAGGAICSALYSAAFNTQSHNKRAAINHVIQGTGAGITKKVQRRIWDVQPCGIHKWLVQPVNIHDSVMTPVSLDKVEEVRRIVKETVETFRPKIPLIKMIWKTGLKNWAKV